MIAAALVATLALVQVDELPESGATDGALAPLDDLMRGFLRERGLPGAAVAVARGGRLLYARGFGHADVEARVPVEPTSRFRIASISKPITSVMILRLVESGRLALDDAAFPIIAGRLELDADACGDPRLDAITIRQLLRHTGGFDRRASFDPMFRPIPIAEALGVDAPASAADVVRYVWRRELDFAPGARVAYSNFGYCVLGRVIEEICDQPYESAVREELLRPLGIDGMRIGASRTSSSDANEVRYHEAKEWIVDSVWNDGARVPVQYGGFHLEAMDAHGGWIASAPELVRFASALDPDATPSLLGDDALGQMFERPAAAEGKAAFYACGWSVRPIGDGANHWHLGALPGTSTLLVRRHDGFSWAVLFNALAEGESPAPAIDPLMHRAVDAVDEWPAGEAFGSAGR